MTPTPAVRYRPEPSVWPFVACIGVTIVGGIALYIDPQLLGLEFVGALSLTWVLSSLFLWSGRKQLNLTRDEQLGCVRIELLRWPLATRVTTFPLAEVRDAIVEVDPMGETSTHRVALVLASGARVPLTDAFCSGGARHERAAREIQALLGLRA